MRTFGVNGDHKFFWDLFLRNPIRLFHLFLGNIVRLFHLLLRNPIRFHFPTSSFLQKVTENLTTSCQPCFNVDSTWLMNICFRILQTKMTISNASTIYHKFHLKLANIVPDTYLLSAAKN